MHKSVDIEEFAEQGMRYIENQKKMEDHHKMVKRLKLVALRQIRYPIYKEAFDYVDNIFPGCDVKEVIIHKASAKAFTKAGVDGAQGFYDPYSKEIIISGKKKRYAASIKGAIIANITDDEVVAHELIHYCYFKEGHHDTTTDITEEFAYGWSIGYLKQKGHNDEEIIEGNFFPYFVGRYMDYALKEVISKEGISVCEYNDMPNYKKNRFLRYHEQKIMDRAKEMAFERGYRIITLYDRLIAEGSNYTKNKQKINKGALLDI